MYKNYIKNLIVLAILVPIFVFSIGNFNHVSFSNFSFTSRQIRRPQNLSNSLNIPGVNLVNFDNKILSNISKKDKNLLKKIISPSVDLKQVVENNPKKIVLEEGKEVNLEEGNLEGRTVYLKLDNEINIEDYQISILRIKGVMPESENNNVLPYKGRGYVNREFNVNEEGNIYVENGEIGPAGTMLSSNAKNEFNIMKELSSLFEDDMVDYPVAWGEFKKLKFDNSKKEKKVGFVVAGMEKKDNRIADIVIPQLMNKLTGENRKIEYSSEKLSRMVGESVRKLHEAGYFHRYLHRDNIGIEGKEVIFRDLDTVVKRESLTGSKEEKIRKEVGYRFLDVMRIVYDYFMERQPHAVSPFVEGYFGDIKKDRKDYKMAVGSCTKKNFTWSISDLLGRGDLGRGETIDKLKINKYPYGDLWSLLKEVTEKKFPH